MSDLKLLKKKNVWLWILIGLIAALACVVYLLASYKPGTEVSYYHAEYGNRNI